MVDIAALKALSRETKALILVSEFEARRMPMFQLRAVLDTIVRDDEEKKLIVDMVESDLRATGYPAEQIAAFLTDLLAIATPKPITHEGAILTTRKLRSPFALGFESPAPPEPEAPKPPLGATIGAGLRRTGPLPPPLAAEPAGGRTQARGALPADSGTPPAPAPAKPAAPAMPGSGAQRRNSFIFNASARSPAHPSAVPVPPPPLPMPTAPAPDMLLPAGTKSLLRHELIFGKPMPGAALVSKPLILIADDDKRTRMVFRLRIEEAGYATVECAGGDEAWARIQQGGVALAVLDMKMPGLHGLEVLSNIADKQLGLPVVICSAYDQLQDEYIVKTYPRLRYLVKPIAPEVLVSTIKELLAAPPKT